MSGIVRRFAVLGILAWSLAVFADDPDSVKIRDYSLPDNVRHSDIPVTDDWRARNSVSNLQEFAFTDQGVSYRLVRNTEDEHDLSVTLHWRETGGDEKEQNLVLPNTFNCRGLAGLQLRDGRLVLVFRNASDNAPFAKWLVGWAGPVAALKNRETRELSSFFFRLDAPANPEMKARKVGRGDSFRLEPDKAGGVLITCLSEGGPSRTMASRWMLSERDLGCTVTFWDRLRPRLEKFKRLLSALADGLCVTVKIFFLTLLFALPLGLIVAFGRMSSNAFLRNLVRLYISVVRGTPLMLQIIFVYYGPNYIFGLSLANYSLLVATVIAFAINYAAYFAEIFRAGIQSIDSGQREAACALGLGRGRTFVHVIFPQVVKRVLPAITNEVITLVKDTSLAFTIALVEMFTVARQAAAAESTIMPLVVAGVFYYVFNYLVASFMEWLERRHSYYL